MAYTATLPAVINKAQTPTDPATGKLYSSEGPTTNGIPDGTVVGGSLVTSGSGPNLGNGGAGPLGGMNAGQAQAANATTAAPTTNAVSGLPQTQTDPTTGLPVAGGTASPYYARSAPSTTAGPDSSLSAAEANLAPTAAPDPEDFFSQVYSQLAPVLDAINQTEFSAEQSADIASEKQTSANNFSQNSQGLAGSSEANSQASANEETRTAAITAAKAAQATAIGNVSQFATTEGYTQYKDALTRNDTNSQAYITQTQNTLKTALSGIAASGVTLSELQSSNPQEYQTLLQYANGDQNSLNALFLQASSSTLINGGQPLTTTGNALIYGIPSLDANGNPTIKAIPVTLPAGVPPSYKMVTNTTTALGGVYTQYAPVGLDGTSISDPTQVKTYLNGQQIAGPGTPSGQTATTVTGGGEAVQAYVTGIQNGTITSIASVPAQFKSQVAEAMAEQGISSPLADTRYTTAVNRIVQNYLALPGYQLTANGLPYLQRIQAAESNPGSVSDQDLLDSISKLNTSGNAISDAQVSVITGGQSYSDFANIVSNKLGNGGVLSDSQREQIGKIASAVYANYQQGYQPIYDQVTKQLTEAGIPDQYWTIPDLNTLYSGQTSTSSGGSSGSDSVSSLASSTSWGSLGDQND